MADVPSPLAAFILGEIRRARGGAGMTQETFGRGAGFSASHVSAVEGGTRALTIDFIKGADRALRTGGLFERLVASLGAPSWFLPWLDAERTATQLRYFEPNLIPGLLQTDAYARAVLRLDPRLSDDEIERRVMARVERQVILTREPPPQLVVVVDEQAIRRAGEGSEKVMAEQLTHLLACAERPHISVHVVPADVGLHAGLSGPLSLARLAGGSWVGHLENQLGGDVVDRPEKLDTLFDRWESVRTEALPRRQSLNLIKEVVSPWI
ncbi:helix-turn-helix transcriptional regulator [Micromonospora peucetia]|uniref:Helix-turn-helix domain-containing protein n=1 Tax=Micromonospora peucetia TaxID=47871 RepID=A0A1C6USC5_9ACTN|nr:helix-turn-helix transcriptional regulator [Micromonospora peucetia]MCX4387282.1 helix-turn-helix transcriptional regulator [Micromonospora peucetia]WSA34706.1 helix-turn-helix transcriptional regulator [Micromonospora peucetia]SCL56719.1 Helix-turn-helix domain-containing protein [Micromonospora peucetia]